MATNSQWLKIITIDMQKDLSEVPFVQYSADNVDHNTCNIGEKGTFHGMGIISMATHKNGMTLVRNRATKRLKSQKKVIFLKIKRFQ